MSVDRSLWDMSDIPVVGGSPSAVGAELRSRACGVIEKMPHATDKIREAAAQAVERDADETSPMARLALATTSPDYFDAFVKLIRSRGDNTGLNPRERDAYTRAMGLTDNQGGFMVPMQLDPSVILTANGSVNEVRKIARVVQATGKVWQGISSAGISGSWDGEAEEVSDDAPTLAQPEIPIHKYQSFVPLSHELQQDAVNLAQEIAYLIAEDKDQKEAVAHVTGTGVGQPTGIVTALTGTSSVVPSTTTDTFAVSDVHNLDAQLSQRYAFNASWLAHRGIYAKMRQFDTNGGASLWGQLADGRKSTLLGRPDYVAEAMDGVINATQDNLVLVFGDFKHYIIADHIGGTTLNYIPNLMGANGRPKGQSGWHAWVRSGAACPNPSAFRVLNVT